MDPKPGTAVTSNVELVRPLGQGGMGSVWVAAHLGLETEVAVKLIAPEHRHRERSLERFRREASSAARIRSPHVVKVFDHGVDGEGTPYIVMELLRGESLAARLGRGERLSPREAALLVLQLSKVLEETRRLGIVHRDLKPDNIFLVDSGYELFVKVLDFGIAKRREGGSPGSLTESGTLVGTPHYMSPEALMSSRDVDHRADLWALAVVAYHALTGELPFRGETFAALSVKIHEARFAPPSSLRAELTADVDAWFKVALCRLPEHRFSSAAELARSFRTACGALTTSEERRGDRDDTLPETADAPIAPSEREEARETPVPPASITIEPELDSGLPSRERSQLQHTLVSAAEDEEERPSAARRSAFAAAASRARGASRRWPLWLAALALGGALAAIAQRQIEAPSLAAKIHLAPAPGERAAELREPPAPTPVADSDPPPPSAAPPPRPSQWASPPPADSSPQPTPPTASAPDCAQPFTTNEHGDLVPRPECFR